MNELEAPPPVVVVGIDGSKHAIGAAIWAIDEAMRRDTALRLLHVMPADADRDFARARRVLHRAWAAVESTGSPVRLESDIRVGDVVATLVDASRSAAMICVGSRGVGRRKRQAAPGHRRGTTAAGLAQGALCPVAIIRRRHADTPPNDRKWVVAALDDSPGSSTALQTAMEEAHRRRAPVLVLTPWNSSAGPDLPESQRQLRAHLESYIHDAELDNAEFAMCTLPRPKEISNMLAQSAGIDQLLVIGPDDPELIAEMVSPKVRAILHKTNCSVLIMRNRADVPQSAAAITTTTGSLVPNGQGVSPMLASSSGQ